MGPWKLRVYCRGCDPAGTLSSWTIQPNFTWRFAVFFFLGGGGESEREKEREKKEKEKSEFFFFFFFSVFRQEKEKQNNNIKKTSYSTPPHPSLTCCKLYSGTPDSTLATTYGCAGSTPPLSKQIALVFGGPASSCSTHVSSEMPG